METLQGEKLRVLWVTSSFPYEKTPIAGVFIKEHAQAARLRDDITLLHLLERQHSIRGLYQVEVQITEDPGSLSLVRVKSKQNALPFSTFPLHIYSAFIGLKECQRQTGRFDLVHAHSYRAGVPAALLAKKLRVPLVITEHNSVFLRKALRGFDYYKASFAYRQAACVLPVSKALQRAIQSYQFGKRFQVIGNTFDPGIFFPGPARLIRGPLQLITVTNLIPLKRIDLLLHALQGASARLPDWKLQVIGDGPEKKNLVEMAAQLGLAEKVVFSGLQPKGQIAEALRSSDLYILSSSLETFSVAALEALACGVPVLATACGGPQDFISPEMGSLIPPDNQSALENGLEDIVSRIDDFDRREIARKIHAKYNYAAIGDQIHQAYYSVLSASSQGLRA
jgi:glycosyltransferase involved in cell wall biosynthesis